MLLEKAQAIGGWMSDRELYWLAKTASDKLTIIEIGCYLGRSTRALADNSPKEAIIYAVDSWDGEYYKDDGSPSDLFSPRDYDSFLLNLSDHIQKNKVRVCREKSAAFTTTHKADFIFIDADHRYEAVCNDIMLALRYIDGHGIIAGHDYGRTDWPGVRKAVDEIFGLTDREDTIWWKQVKS